MDTVAEILSVQKDGNALSFRFRPRDPSVLKYVVEKGYICLDGASLTVTEVDDHEAYFGIMMVAYTQEKVIMPSKQVGDLVNVEVDMIGKYIEKQTLAQLDGMTAESGVLERMVERVVTRVLDRRA